MGNIILSKKRKKRGNISIGLETQQGTVVLVEKLYQCHGRSHHLCHENLSLMSRELIIAISSRER